MTPEKGNDKVDRRDFINGVLIAAGAAAVGGSLPMRAYDGGTTFPCDGPIGSDLRRTIAHGAQLLSASQADAFDQVTLSPVLVANVTIPARRRSRTWATTHTTGEATIGRIL